MKIYCMSDVHGFLDEFEQALSLVLPHLTEDDAQLVLLGDYIHGGPKSYAVLDRIMSLQNEWGADKVIALLGNHEQMVLDGRQAIDPNKPSGTLDEKEYFSWMRHLPLYHVCDQVIFVHAGIDEDAEDLWRYGTEDYVFVEKFPAETGPFMEGWNIVAGHVGTAAISGDPSFHDVYYDGQAHYYIDGTVEQSGVVPVLLCDTKAKKFYQVDADGLNPVIAYDLLYGKNAQ